MVELDRNQFQSIFLLVFPILESQHQAILPLQHINWSHQVIEIKSGESIIRYIEKVETKPLDITGVMESFKKEVPLELDVSSFSRSCGISLLYQFQFKKKLLQKKFKDITVKTKNCLNKCRIFSNVEITNTG